MKFWAFGLVRVLFGFALLFSMFYLDDYIDTKTEAEMCEEITAMRGLEARMSSRGVCYVKTERGWVTRHEFLFDEPRCSHDRP